MRSLLDVRFLWVLGAANLVFSAVGLAAAAAAVGFPLVLGAAAFGLPQEEALRWLAYSSPLWAPVGAGAGLAGAGALTKGLRRRVPAEAQERRGDDGA